MTNPTHFMLFQALKNMLIRDIKDKYYLLLLIPKKNVRINAE